MTDALTIALWAFAGVVVTSIVAPLVARLVDRRRSRIDESGELLRHAREMVAQMDQVGDAKSQVWKDRAEWWRERFDFGAAELERCRADHQRCLEIKTGLEADVRRMEAELRRIED